ncbi:hypothetical protein K3495_g9560 [Podosphaera aphanis]|nr:hypothetical protein K3495_g9560 [Podosphaera aphanis]
MQQWPSRKRERQEMQEHDSGFAEHEQRTKRQNFTSTRRKSPNLHDRLAPIFLQDANQEHSLAQFPTSVGRSAASNIELYTKPKNIVRTDSSTPIFAFPLENDAISAMMMPPMCSQSPPNCYTEDLEMKDPVSTPSSPMYHNVPLKTSSRTPTPIHSSFSSSIRSEENNDNMHNSSSAQGNISSGRINLSRRLPSPITEGNVSPSIIVTGINDMQVGIDGSSLSRHVSDMFVTKGHSRSDNVPQSYTTGNTRNPSASGIKKEFFLGYRADCEKCRMKVPGHFSHIVYH